MTILTKPWPALRSSYTTAGVTVRPLQPGDAHLIEEMHQRLSPDSLYYRYLRYRPPTPAEIAAVCRLAPETGAGLVVTTQEAPTAIVGVAYYVREPHAAEPTAELGILIEDRFQGQGIGRRLWQRLQQQAQADGVCRLRLLVHPHNQRMAWLVQGSGLPYTTKADDGLREYLVTLTPRSLPTTLEAAPTTRRGAWHIVNPIQSGPAIHHSLFTIYHSLFGEQEKYHDPHETL